MDTSYAIIELHDLTISPSHELDEAFLSKQVSDICTKVKGMTGAGYARCHVCQQVFGGNCMCHEILCILSCESLVVKDTLVIRSHPNLVF